MLLNVAMGYIPARWRIAPHAERFSRGQYAGQPGRSQPLDTHPNPACSPITACHHGMPTVPGITLTAGFIMHSEIIDIGCGNNKLPGSFGVDLHPYEGVDKVVNLDEAPWDLPSASFKRINATHVIEHVHDLVMFMREIHRIAQPDAEVVIVTPHFSSFNSWADPTHRRHMTSNWHELFDTGYLAAQTGRFACVESGVTFGQSFRSKIGKMLVRLFGLRSWEKTYAFSYPGMDLRTVLRVVKG